MVYMQQKPLTGVGHGTDSSLKYNAGYDERGSEMIIREVSINDADALSEIYKYYVDNFSYSFEYAAPSAGEFAGRIKEISEKFPFFVCEDKGEIIGYAYAHKFRERKAYQWVCETSVYVKNNCTQKGVGKLLYDSLIPALKEQGVNIAGHRV